MMWPIPPTPPVRLPPKCIDTGEHDWSGWNPTERDGDVTLAMSRRCRNIGCNERQDDRIIPFEEATT